ncbi:phosphotransferase [Demequina sp. B12]|uniref:phosphotransferase n=1 Tax=Demequina sp. B12 TaxID=2992757 RepID=UPI00237C254B|nr:phosphotransferase [Demequina sp. B12]MDE0572044.1 phosphotransferase [Demequina sp. B12]
MATPAAEVHVDDTLVRSLLAAQHPDLADLTLGPRVEGWDNITYRLGDTLAVRLPRREMGARIATTELDWLPRIGSQWTFPAPVPQRIGQPTDAYPWRWSVVPWIQGDMAYDAPLNVDGARDLGHALAQVHTTAPSDAPLNPVRSRTLRERAETFDHRLRLIEADHPMRTATLREAFRAALEAASAPSTWTHLDLHGENVLTRHGRLAGILDWGDAAVGSPATDLGQASVLVGREHVMPMLDAYAGTADRSVATFIASAAGRLAIRAEALNYAVTLAAMEDQRYRNPGLRALQGLSQRSSRTLS